MSNPPRKKGTAAESAVVHWARLHGFGQADRQPLRGNRDAGDINLTAGVIAECKNYRLPTGIPTPGQLALWLAQAAAEKANAGAAYCPLIVKRPGTTDVGRWHAYMPASDFALLTGGYLPASVDGEPVMTTVAALALILRAHGFGDPIENGEAA